jgi:hypothetical protein
MLKIAMLYRGRTDVTLARFGILWENPNVSEGTTGNLLGLE